MEFNNTEELALQLDKADPLAGFRDRFHFPHPENEERRNHEPRCQCEARPSLGTARLVRFLVAENSFEFLTLKKTELRDDNDGKDDQKQNNIHPSKALHKIFEHVLSSISC